MTETASDPTSDTAGQTNGATPARPTTDDADAWKSYWQAQGMPWRTEPEIAAERQAYLAERRAITPSISRGVYPFKDIEPKLTRADIEWLLTTHESLGDAGLVFWDEEKDKPSYIRRQGLDLRGADLNGLDLRGLPLTLVRAGLSLREFIHATGDQRSAAAAQLSGANLHSAHLKGAVLRRAQLERVILGGAHLAETDLSLAHLNGADLAGAELTGVNLFGAELTGANLSGVLLTGANLFGVHLEGVNLSEAQLEEGNLREAQLMRVDLSEAHLKGADLVEAQLEGASLHGARLKEANLSQAQLEGADLTSAQLEGANLTQANLQRADLRGASLDKASLLYGATLKLVSLDQTIFDNTNLSVVRWQDVPILGDELRARSRKGDDGKRKTRQQRVEGYQAAARAYRRLAVALQTNGMNDEADTYRYRAQLMQRRFHWHSRRFGRWSFSALLALLAGYGYKPARSFLTYALVIAVFTGLFILAGLGVITFGLAATQYHELPWYEALVLSVASFHGRGFFQPVQSPGDPIAILAAIEAVFGLFIEVTFIATFTQRFFGK